MLSSATEEYTKQAQLSVVGVAAARRAWAARRIDLLPATIAQLMIAAARAAEVATEAAVEEQALQAPPVAPIAPLAFGLSGSDGRSLASLFALAETRPVLESMAVTQIADSWRAATSVAITTRPNLDGYIRNVGATCCSRCAILAGRFYRYSDGFERHPKCRCTNVPTTLDRASDYIETPDDLFAQGRITGLSKADTRAIEDGADMGRVINSRRRSAGLSVAGRVLSRGNRLMPEGIYQLASDRDQALDLLKRYGFIL